MNPLTVEIIKEVQRHYNKEKAERVKRYFKEHIESWGIPMPVCREIAGVFYPRVKKNLPLALQVIGELHQKGVIEVIAVGDYMLTRMKRQLKPEHFYIFDGWVDTLNNWANTDGLCTGIISETIRKDPRLVERLLDWVKSDNRWRRRAAVVCLVPIVRDGDMLPDIFRISDKLMEDEDEMVQKGVGWLLKEASKKHPDKVRAYLLTWKEHTSSLILRYASEKLEKKERVLKKSKL